MLYQLEQGRVEQQIIQQCIRDRRPLPERIRNAPELQLGLELYYGAFFDLQTSRGIGMEEGPIPWLAVHEYCKQYEITGEQYESMHYMIRAMDTTYFEYRDRKAKK